MMADGPWVDGTERPELLGSGIEPNEVWLTDGKKQASESSRFNPKRIEG
jgi:hypothetical protein